MKNITILGSTGSIGVSTLEIVAAHPDRFRIIALTAGKNLELFTSQIKLFAPRIAVVACESDVGKLKEMCSGLDVEILGGVEGLISAATAVRFAACLRRTEDLSPKANPRRRGHGRLVPYEGFFVELVEQDPDITLKELQAALLDAHDVQASLSGIDVVLRRLDLTYKKRASSRMRGANPM